MFHSELDTPVQKVANVISTVERWRFPGGVCVPGRIFLFKLFNVLFNPRTVWFVENLILCESKLGENFIELTFTNFYFPKSVVGKGLDK